ncbi:MAG: hypothetical protein WC254_02560 [Candidatus Woesearchaeota archaeon]|jgi:hypothetical protein
MFQRRKKDLDEILSFEEFRANPPSNSPHHNNFVLYFIPTITIFNKRKYFRRFVSEDSNLYQELCVLVDTRVDFKSPKMCEQIKSFEPKLYLAYIIMRSYGASDRQLFA